MLVFVYGSLKRGLHNHSLLERHGAKYVGNDVVSGRLVNLGAFPGLVPFQGNWIVRGEVYIIDNKALSALDYLEGHPVFYKREVVILPIFGPAWVYYYQHAKDMKQEYVGDENEIVSWNI